MEPQDKEQKPWYRQRWPWLLMIGPAWVVVGVSMVRHVAVTVVTSRPRS